jgi:hypothetical protein
MTSFHSLQFSGKYLTDGVEHCATYKVASQFPGDELGKTFYLIVG